MKKLINLLLLPAILLITSCSGNAKKEQINIESIDAFVRSSIENIAGSIKIPEIIGDTIDLIDFSGLSPDMNGTHDFNNAFLNAIREIEKRGGGTIYLRHTKGKGAWIKETDCYRFSGPIDLCSNLTLLLDPGVELIFDAIPENYNNNEKGVLTRYEGTTIYGYSPLIRAFNKENIAIKAVKGNGAPPVICGNGEKWQAWSNDIDIADSKNGITPGYMAIREDNNNNTLLKERNFSDLALRPDLIQFFLCKNVLLDGVFLKESPFWVVHSVFSENLVFKNLIYDAHVVNNDGIDVESSRNVLIENILFNNHDDNVVIKAGRDQEGMFGVDISGTELESISSSYIIENRLGGKTENVAVRNCVFQGHHAVCVGSEMSGGAENIFIADCFSPQFVYMGLYLKGSRSRGGEVRNVYMVNCKFNKVLNDVVGLIPNYDGDTLSPYPSYFHDIYLQDIDVQIANNGVRSLGWPDRLIENVFIKNMNIKEVVFEPMDIKQSSNIQFDNVVIGDESYNLRLDHHDENFKPSRVN